MYTHHKLKFLAEREADYSEHSLELVVWIIDASRGLVWRKPGTERKCTYAANKSGLSGGEQRIQRDVRGMDRDKAG